MTLVAPKGLVLVTVASLLSTELAPAGRENGQDCEGAYGQAPIRSLLIPSMGLVGRLENESTDHNQGIAPVPFRVRPEPRWPGWDYRSPIFADNLHSMISRTCLTLMNQLIFRHSSRRRPLKLSAKAFSTGLPGVDYQRYWVTIEL